MPTTVALTVEWAPADRLHRYNALMFSGYSVGGILAALLAIWFLPDHGFRLLFALGMLPLVTVVPLAWRFLPESRQFDPAHKTPAARALPRALFTGPKLTASILFPLASFCGLLLVYGLNTWLPKIMQKAGYPLTSSLAFLVMLNVGAVIGALSGSTVADRLGAKVVTAAGFVVAACAVLLMSRGLSVGTLYVVVAAAGLGSVGTQILLNGYVASYYGATHRASALGWTLGVGRLGAILGPTVGGWLLASSLGVDWNFYAFALAAAAGTVLVLCIPPLTRGRTRGAGRLTFGSPGTHQRQGDSSPLPGLRPMRTELPGSAGGGVPSSSRTTGPAARSVPSRSPVRPSAWQRRAGPEQRSRSRRALGRRDHIASSPSNGASARISTRPATAGRVADDVAAPVHAVGEVDVQPAGRAEHGGVALARTPKGMRPGIDAGAEVGLGLDDAAGDRAVDRIMVDEHLVEKIDRHLPGIPDVERRRNRQPVALSHPSPAGLPGRPGRPGPIPVGRPPMRCRLRRARSRRRTEAPGSRAARASGPSWGSVMISSSRGMPRSTDSRTSFPTMAWASRNGMPPRTRSSARSAAALEGASAAARIRS